MTFIKRNLKIIIGIIISLCALFLLFLNIDIDEIYHVALSANYLYIFPAIILYFAWLYMRSLRLKYMLDRVHSVSAKNVYIVELIGYMSNNLLPMRAGEIIRCIYLCRKEKDIKFSTAAAVLFTERVCEAIVLLVLGLITIGALIYFDLIVYSNDTYSNILISFIIFALCICVACFTIAIFAARNSKITELILAINNFIFRKYAVRVNAIVVNFISGLKLLKSTRTIGNIFAMSVVVWITETLMYIIVAYSFDIDIYFISFATFFVAMFAVMMASNLFGAIPSSVGGIGIFELAAQQMLIVLGVDNTVATLYPLVLHILVFTIPIIIVGLVILWIDNISLSKIKSLKSN